MFVSVIVIYYSASMTYPFIIAFVIAFMINPLVDYFETRWKLPRGLSVLFTLMIIFLLFAGIVILLIVEMINGLIYLANEVPGNFQKLIIYLESFFVAQILPIYHQLTSMFNNLNPTQQSTILENIQSISAQMTSSFTKFVQALAAGMSKLIVSLPSVATVLVFSLLATFFISKDWYRLKHMFRKIVPKKALKSSMSVYAELRNALFGFMKAQLTLMTITSIIVLIGLWILRVDYAFTIALVIGLVDLVPYVGTGLVFIPWIVYNFFTENYPLTIGLSILYGIVIIQRQMMEPKLLSSSIGLDPLATLIALFIGFQLFGFLGLLIGPALLVIGKTLYQTGILKEIWGIVVGKK